MNGQKITATNLPLNQMTITADTEYTSVGFQAKKNGKEAMKIALADGDYLVQERVKTAKQDFPFIDDEGKVHMTPSLVDLDPLLFNGKVHSSFTRLSTTELANVTSGGGMVPTLILKEK